MAAAGEEQSSAANCLGWAARDPSGFLSPFKFSRRVPGPHDVSYRITHCGVCHAELLWTRNAFGHTKYPIVPGHEMAGIVTEVGSDVSRFKVGDRVGTSTYVNSCQDCEFCDKRMEIYCDKGVVLTYDSIDHDGSITRGGFSTHIVVHERYCVRIPDTLRLEHAAPLLCAGITVYSPMMRHGMNKHGTSIGVLGLGGLGHLAVKFGKAFGGIVTVLSTSPSKKDEALTVLGADKFIITSNATEMQQAARSLDFIIDTAAAEHPLDLYLPLLKTGGTFVVVGAPKEMKFTPVILFVGMKSIAGSAVGGTKEMQEMVDFCGEKDINNNNASDRARADLEAKDIMECSENVQTSTSNISPKAAIVEIEYQDMQIVPVGANIGVEVDLVSLKSNKEDKDVITNNNKDNDEIDTMEKEKGASTTNDGTQSNKTDEKVEGLRSITQKKYIPHAINIKKHAIILDLNGILVTKEDPKTSSSSCVHICLDRYKIVTQPGCLEFLEDLCSQFYVGIWSTMLHKMCIFM